METPFSQLVNGSIIGCMYWPLEATVKQHNRETVAVTIFPEHGVNENFESYSISRFFAIFFIAWQEFYFFKPSIKDTFFVFQLKNPFFQSSLIRMSKKHQRTAFFSHEMFIKIVLFLSDEKNTLETSVLPSHLNQWCRVKFSQKKTEHYYFFSKVYISGYVSLDIRSNN